MSVSFKDLIVFCRTGCSIIFFTDPLSMGHLDCFRFSLFNYKSNRYPNTTGGMQMGK